MTEIQYVRELRRQRLKWPYELKVQHAKWRIRQWQQHYGEQTYVAFSGGKDSRVLLALVREDYPHTPGVFVDSGLEFPEVRDYVQTIKNVTWLKPGKSFKQVLHDYGYPVISKQISKQVHEMRTGRNNAKTRQLYLSGGKSPRFRFPDKWKFLLDAPFPISAQCCDVMKKRTFRAYTRQTGRVGFIGLLASESRQRLARYLHQQCNLYDAAVPTSSPLALWTEADIWRYIQEHHLPMAASYALGYPRTGCLFCLFGLHLESPPNRLQRLKTTHPSLHAYCLDTLGIRDVCAYLGLPCE